MTASLIGCNTLFAADNPLDHSVNATLCALERVAAAGYGAVEYSHCTGLPVDQAAAVGAYAQSLGLLNWSCHAPFFPSEGDWSDSYYVSGLSQALETCAQLGAQVVVVHVPLKLGLLKPDQHLDYATYRAFDRRIMTHLAPRCQELGVALALENSHTRKHMTYIQSLVAELGDPLIGLCVDTGHAALGDLGAAQAVRLAGDTLLTLHLQDNRGQVDDHLPPGSGLIDWPDVAEALREVGYYRTLQLELTDNAPHRPYDQAAEMAAGYAFVARLFALPRER